MTQLSKKNKKFLKNEHNNKIINFDVEISDLQKTLNPNLSLAKCKIFYVGENRNGSIITQECADDMATQLAYTAVVGEWKSDIDNFGGHGGKIELSDDGIEYIDTTIAYGCAMDTPTWYEDVIEDDGTTHSYLCCNLVLFTGKFPELQKVVENNMFQSMEIEVEQSEEKDGFIYIHKATFSALCILGKDDENPNNSTEPCFESSTIEVPKEQVYSLLKQEIKKEFSLILGEIKDGLNTNLKNNNSSDFNLNNNSTSNKEEKKNMNKNEIAKKFALTMEQLEDELRRNLRTKTYVCDDWYGDPYECRKYYLEDYDDNFVYAYDCEQDIYVKLSYAKQGDDVVIDFDSTSRVRSQFVDWVGATPEGDESVDDDNIDPMGDMEMSLKETYTKKFEEKLNTKVDEAVKAKETEFVATLEETKADFETKISEKDNKISELELSVKDGNEKYDNANKEIETLNEYKLAKENEAKESKFAEYADELTEDEIKPIKEKINEYSLEIIDDKLAILFAKKNHKANKNVLPKHNVMDTEKYELNNNSEEISNSNVWNRISKNN